MVYFLVAFPLENDRVSIIHKSWRKSKKQCFFPSADYANALKKGLEPPKPPLEWKTYEVKYLVPKEGFLKLSDAKEAEKKATFTTDLEEVLTEDDDSECLTAFSGNTSDSNPSGNEKSIESEKDDDSDAESAKQAKNSDHLRIKKTNVETVAKPLLEKPSNEVENGKSSISDKKNTGAETVKGPKKPSNRRAKRSHVESISNQHLDKPSSSEKTVKITDNTAARKTHKESAAKQSDKSSDKAPDKNQKKIPSHTVSQLKEQEIPTPGGTGICTKEIGVQTELSGILCNFGAAALEAVGLLKTEVIPMLVDLGALKVQEDTPGPSAPSVVDLKMPPAPFKFSIMTPEELEAFEEEAANEDFCNSMLVFLTYLCGKDLKSTASRIYESLLAPDVAAKFSLKGMGTKEPFNSLGLYKIVRDFLMAKYGVNAYSAEQRAEAYLKKVSPYASQSTALKKPGPSTSTVSSKRKTVQKKISFAALAKRFKSNSQPDGVLENPPSDNQDKNVVTVVSSDEKAATFQEKEDVDPSENQESQPDKENTGDKKSSD